MVNVCWVNVFVILCGVINIVVNFYRQNVLVVKQSIQILCVQDVAFALRKANVAATLDLVATIVLSI